jgi:rubrerythrin
MMKEKTLDIIKGAILLEHRGKALYEAAVQKTEVEEVKELFQMLVDEETKHIAILNKQFALVNKGGDFDAGGLEKVKGATVDAVLSDKIVQGISGAGFEASVISAALDLEKKAVDYYREKEDEADSDEEKKLFNWLVKWEKEHMTMLAKIDNDVKENIWYDNSFWPQ